MIKSEFITWRNDFKARFPDIGVWIESHKDTLKIWFDDVFCNYPLEECLEVNRRLMSQGIESFDRQKIPAMVAKLAQEINWERSEAAKQKQSDIRREADRKRKEYKSPVTGSMRQALEEMNAWTDNFKVEFGREAYLSERRKWLDDWFEKNDDSDPQDEPRYRCLRCRDTGLVSYRDEKKRYTCGHCDCAKGISERDRYFNAKKPGHAHGMTIGPAPRGETWTIK